MHQTGVRMTNEVLRDGQVYHKASAEVFDFEQQGVHHVAQESYKVMPGDSFRTACYYKDGTTFGLASQEEMCIAYIMYYPAKALSQGMPWVCSHQPWREPGAICAQEFAHYKLDSVDDLERNFGKPSNECALELSGTNTSTNGKFLQCAHSILL